MNNKSCQENKHRYGLWDIDNNKNIAYRVCDRCKFIRELPITEEITTEIVKQKEASKIFNAFQLISDNDTNIINYLELILEDYINYLNKNDFSLLIKRIKKLEKLDIIDAKHILYLNQLDTYFVIDDLNTTPNNSIELIEQEELNINIDSYEQS